MLMKSLSKAPQFYYYNLEQIISAINELYALPRTGIEIIIQYRVHCAAIIGIYLSIIFTLLFESQIHLYKV